VPEVCQKPHNGLKRNPEIAIGQPSQKKPSFCEKTTGMRISIENAGAIQSPLFVLFKKCISDAIPFTSVIPLAAPIVTIKQLGRALTARNPMQADCKPRNKVDCLKLELGTGTYGERKNSDEKDEFEWLIRKENRSLAVGGVE
jgi:hypothetical protein